MSSPLRLVPTGGSPLRVGDRVRVPEPVTTASGRRVRRGTYPVLAVRGRAVVVPWRPDTSDLPRIYHPPSAEGVRAGAPVPLAAQPTSVTLYPHEYTAFAEGDRPLYIHDR